MASTTPRVLVRTFLELSWLATVWHFSASSTVRTRALRRSVSGYCFSLASSDNSLKSENSRRSSPRASRAFLTYNQNRGHQQFLEDVILHPVQYKELRCTVLTLLIHSSYASALFLSVPRKAASSSRVYRYLRTSLSGSHSIDLK